MAGVKGKSGGPRPNSGGARPGAGRPPKETLPLDVPIVAPGERSPLEFLLHVMEDVSAEPALRVRAAGLAAQYVHTKRADGGKREEAAEKAQKAGAGKFATPKPPKLVVNNGK